MLEADYGAEGTRVLTRYELDMGLNHVVRRSSHPVNPLAHRLCPVPGGADGPGGVVVCAPGQVRSSLRLSTEDESNVFFNCLTPFCQVSWTSAPADERTAVREVTVAFPTRAGGSGESMVVAWAAHRHKTKFFFLLQVEEGDVFK